MRNFLPQNMHSELVRPSLDIAASQPARIKFFTSRIWSSERESRAQKSLERIRFSLLTIHVSTSSIRMRIRRLKFVLPINALLANDAIHFDDTFLVDQVEDRFMRD